MIKGKTESGFEFEVSDQVLDDYELMEAIGEAEGNPLLVTKVIKILLGDDVSKAKEFIKKTNGYVSATAMSALVTDIFGAISNGKN